MIKSAQITPCLAKISEEKSGNIWYYLAISGIIWQQTICINVETNVLSIEKMLQLPEGRTLEFKESLTSSKPILKTLVAFANTAGGTLIIGRKDDGTILGVKDVLTSEEKLSNIIADSIYPPLMPEIEIASINGHSLLVVRVSHWRGPFYLKSEGEINGVYVRLGSTNRAADAHLLEELKRSIKKVSFDQLPLPEVDVSGLDMARLQEAFSKIGKIVDTHLLETLNILVPYNGHLVCSNGGLILFGQDNYRGKYFPNTEVRCARFQSNTKVNFIDQYDTKGTILEAIHEIPKFIQRNTRLAASIKATTRKNIPEYSPLVIREVLANALVHADYSIQGMNPRVAIFSDRLEIESPGMLPYGYTLPDFFAGVSHARNKVIARVFRELYIIEEWGTGYRRIKDACQDANYPLPNWQELGTSLRVILKPHIASQEQPKTDKLQTSTDFTTREEKIIKLLQNKTRLTTKELHKQLKPFVSERTIRKDLLNLKEKGIIKMIGRGPSTQWTLK